MCAAAYSPSPGEPYKQGKRFGMTRLHSFSTGCCYSAAFCSLWRPHPLETECCVGSSDVYE